MHRTRREIQVTDPPYSPGDHIQGWMDGHELNWLYDTAKQMASVVEIGSWRGRSTFALCTSGCPRVIAVDHFHGSIEHQPFIRDEKLDLRADFYKNVGHFENLRIVEKPSAEAATIIQKMEGTVDMVFIDASHDYESVREDLRLWAPLARKIVAGHDYGYDSVQRPVVEYFGRGRDRRCNAIWAMMVDGYQLPGDDGKPDVTDDTARNMVAMSPDS